MTVRESVSVGPRHDIITSDAGTRLIYWDRTRQRVTLNVGACERDIDLARQSREWGYICIILAAEPDEVITLDRGQIMLTRDMPRGHAGRWHYRVHMREVDGGIIGRDVPPGASIASFVEAVTGINIYEVVASQYAYETSGDVAWA